jgi:DNA-binding NarL/FixJ family response regulator
VSVGSERIVDDVRVLLADDHTMLREGLRRSLEAAGVVVIGEAGDGEEAVRLAGALTPDVVLMDVSMPNLDGIEATRLVRRHHPGIKVVVLTMHADEDVVRRAAEAGAAGYLVKDCTTEEVVDAVRRAAAGEITVVPPADTNSTGAAGITRREAEVLQLIARGAATNQVADRLFISAKTVKNHLASAYQKLDARDRTQAILTAVRLGIITID